MQQTREGAPEKKKNEKERDREKERTFSSFMWWWRCGGALMSLFCVSFVLEAPMRRQSPHPPWWSGGQACNTTSESATAIADSSSSWQPATSYIGSDDRRLPPSARRLATRYCELEMKFACVVLHGHPANGDQLFPTYRGGRQDRQW